MTPPDSTEIVFKSPWLYPKQRDAIFSEARYAVIEASTKSGKTVGCIVWLLEKTLEGKAGQNFWWIAPTFQVAKIAFRRMKRGLPQWFYKPNDTELFIELLNGTVIWFKGADRPDSLYGEDVYAAVIDEATRCKEEAWHAVRSTLTATNGPIRIIGNVKGKKNWAYKLARLAAGGAKDMAYYKIRAADAVEAGIIKAEEVADAKEKLPENIFKQLYDAEPCDDEGNPFRIEAIRARIAPLSLDEPTSWGWDLAKSVDWTVGIGLDGNGRTSRFFRYQMPWLETIADIIAKTGRVSAMVDSTGVGDPVLEALQDHGLRNNFKGFQFTGHSKQQLMERLAVAIQQGTITYPAGQIVDELENFEYAYTSGGVRYSAPEGMHDDCVCALALAVWGHQRNETQEVNCW